MKIFRRKGVTLNCSALFNILIIVIASSTLVRVKCVIESESLLTGALPDYSLSTAPRSGATYDNLVGDNLKYFSNAESDSGLN